VDTEARDKVVRARELLAGGDIHEALAALDKTIEEYPPLSDRQRLENARGVINQQISAALDAAAEAIAKDWKSGEYDGSSDAVTEAIEAEASMNNPREAIEYLYWSDNDGAYFQENGDGDAHRQGIDWCLLAYYARRQDLYDALDNEGINLNKRPPRNDEFWCDECEEVQDKEYCKDDKCRGCYEADGNTLCAECYTWHPTDDVDADEVCRACRPLEEEGASS
jgi:hypothetical protein